MTLKRYDYLFFFSIEIKSCLYLICFDYDKTINHQPIANQSNMKTVRYNSEFKYLIGFDMNSRKALNIFRFLDGGQ